MTTFSAVDLSRLPLPESVETIDFEALLSEIIDLLRDLHPAFTATVESDPAYKIAEVIAYREILLRQRVNEGIKSTLLAYATGATLDHLGAYYGVARLVVDEGDPERGIPVEMERNEDYRARIQMAPEGFSVAGPAGAYISHARAADARVVDAGVSSPQPGHVSVYVLSSEAGGVASADLIAAVTKAVNAEEVRPLTDFVTVLGAAIVEYEIAAELIVLDGPDPAVVMTAAQQAAEALAAASARIGQPSSLSAIYKALHQVGVQRVNLASPTADVEVGAGEAPRCTAINLTYRLASNA